MDEALHRFFQEAMPEELKEAKREGKTETAVSLFQKGVISAEQAAEELGLSVEEFHKLVLEYPKA